MERELIFIREEVRELKQNSKLPNILISKDLASGRETLIWRNQTPLSEVGDGYVTFMQYITCIEKLSEDDIIYYLHDIDFNKYWNKYLEFFDTPATEKDPFELYGTQFGLPVDDLIEDILRYLNENYGMSFADDENVEPINTAQIHQTLDGKYRGSSSSVKVYDGQIVAIEITIDDPNNSKVSYEIRRHPGAVLHMEEVKVTFFQYLNSKYPNIMLDIHESIVDIEQYWDEYYAYCDEINSDVCDDFLAHICNFYVTIGPDFISNLAEGISFNTIS